MFIGRFAGEGEPFYGEVKGELVAELTRPSTSVLEFTKTGTSYQLDQLKVLVPSEPTKVVGVGLNYVEHIKELGMPFPTDPILFLKPVSTLIAHDEPITVTGIPGRIDFEGELAVIMKKEAYKVPKEKATEHILGYTCANDVTNRDMQKSDVQWTRAKGFNTFLPLGPFINTDVDPSTLEIILRQNGEVKQDSHTSDMLFTVDELISYISFVMPLYAGDVVITGTPPGVAPIRPADTLEVYIQNIGTLRNAVE